MNRFVLAMLLLLGGGVNAFAQKDKNPPVIAKLEEFGTVYLTWKPFANPADAARKGDLSKKAIHGVDFRPMAGSDPKKIGAAVKELATLPDLQFVLLLGQPITDEALDSLPTGLLSVQLFNTRVTDKGIAQLTRCKNLTTFNFTGMGLTDAGMRELAKIKTLQNITITDAKVTDAGVLALKGLTNLRRLTIENTLATERAVERLRESLPKLTSGERFLR